MFDCVVIGAGPAGCTAATVMAEQGCSVLLVERESMPRHHVGESLMPEVYWPLQRIGMLDKMKQAGFVEKRSVQFVSHSGKESAPFYFDEHDPRDCSRTWQVERAEFDQLLFENAREKGVDCRDQTRVKQVRFDGPRAVGVQIEADGSAPEEIACQVVVDASGQQAFLATRLGLRRDDPELRKAAVWGHFHNAWRDVGKNEGATVILHTADKLAWFWNIPLAQNVVSVGVVSDTDRLFSTSRDPRAVFQHFLQQCERMNERLGDATLVNDKFYVNREFSYATRRHAGPGWVLIGDAFGFIDPIYSSGVYFAMCSAERAGDCIVRAIRDGDLSGERLGEWCESFKQGAQWVRKLVDKFYTPDFSFGSFMKRHPEHRGGLTDLLIGRIFHENAGDLFRDM